MYRRVMAFDLDGTLAVNGVISPEIERCLDRCRAAGHALFLVTGRRFETVPLNHVEELFIGVVWENGAVLAHTATGELYLPFGRLNPSLFKALEEAAIPFERGLAIAATWIPHDQAVWHILTAQGGGAVVEYNKGAVMLLPPGAAKGAGLDRLLSICGFSRRNLVAFGDAENDRSMLELAEVAVAVGDAIPAIKDLADVVAAGPGPTGVLEILEEYPLAGRYLDIPLRRERPVLLGKTETGREVSLPASRLAGRNLGVFGDSGTGKSWMVGLLAEGLHHEDYQVLAVDPEGDFRGLRALPRFVALDGDESSLPPPTAVAALLEVGGVSIVLELSQYPTASRARYLAELFHALRPIRARKYRPHWILLEEAQQFLFHGRAEVTAAAAPMLEEGGWAFVSYRPDRIDATVLKSLHHYLFTRLTSPEAIKAVQDYGAGCKLDPSLIRSISMGSALLCSGEMVTLQPGIRRIPHIRHLYKYLDIPLPPHKRFWFRDGQGGVGAEASSLYEFLHLIPGLPLSSLEYHDRRQDFVRWATGALGDEGLTARLRKIANRQLKGEELRLALHQTVAAHYDDLNALR